jgi:DMSO/TMAO reductase YedYZ molybdopterin-dependent catalytic subunit
VEFLDPDVAGFWERNGDHAYGDPRRKQRYTGDA